MSERAAERRVNYRDVESLLIDGFLSHSISVFDAPLTLRTLFPQELRDAVLATAHQGSYHYQVFLVSRAIYCFSGYFQRSRDICPELLDAVYHFPKRLLYRLFCEVQGLFFRYQRALSITQAFSYENYSRTHWYTYRGVPENCFGLVNGVQTIWQYVNSIEDRFERSEVDWNHAKFIASAMSPKGVKKQNSKDENRRKRMTSEREEYIEKSLRYLSTKDESDKPILITAKTDEQLMEEYHRWVKGEQDEHDLIVQRYKDRIRQGMIDRQVEREKRIQSFMDGSERGIFSSTRVADGEFDRTGFTNVRTLGHEGSQNRLYKRFVGREETGGQFYVDETGNVRKK